MSTVDYKPFANSGGANVVDQATYAAATWVPTGFASGLAQSAQLNKVWRQSSMMSAALATFISNQLGIDVLDDGVLATLITNLTAAIPVSLPGFTKLSILVTGNTGATMTADFAEVQNAAGATIRLASINVTETATANGAGGVDVGSALSANGDWHIYLIYNPTTATKASIVSQSATAPTLPSGYTYYAYAGTLKTDGASHFYTTLQKGRKTSYIVNTLPAALPPIATTTVAVGNPAVPTWVAIQARGTGSGVYAPANATEIDITMQTWSISSGGGVTRLWVAPNNHYGLDYGANPPPFTPWSQDMGATQSGTILLESDSIYWMASGNFGKAAVFMRGWTNPVLAS